MIDIAVRHSRPKRIDNYGHLVTEIFPVVCAHLRERDALHAPDRVRIWADTRLKEPFSVFSSHPVGRFADRPPDAPVLDEALPVSALEDLLFRFPIRVRTPIRSRRRTRHFEAITLLRSVVAERFPFPPPDGRAITLIQRGGHRRIRCPGLVDALGEIGRAREVCLESLTFAEQVRVIRESRCLIGAHGAGLAGMAFMEPGLVVEIFPRRFVIDYYRTLAAPLGHAYRAIEGSNPLRTRWPAVYTASNRARLRDVPWIECSPERIRDEVRAWLRGTGDRGGP